ncbi:hypothetical protein L7F22_031609, partial [Adiantum nelumboides]|nr:hypothetical protein [Adiantum nelumboides]
LCVLELFFQPACTRATNVGEILAAADVLVSRDELAVDLGPPDSGMWLYFSRSGPKTG